MITNSKLGGRTVELFIPFQHGGTVIDKIVLAPIRFGDALRWGEGEFKTSFALLAELAGVDDTVIRSLRYPDADRVMEAFISMLPTDLRDDIASGRIPVKPQSQPREPEEPAGEAEEIVTNGSGAPVDEVTHMPLSGPGVPLPEAGFDLSEEEAP